MSTSKNIICPRCGEKIQLYKNPIPTVDIIIEYNQKIVLINRKNIPHGWAIPGGFVDYGESLETAAARPNNPPKAPVRRTRVRQRSQPMVRTCTSKHRKKL